MVSENSKVIEETGGRYNKIIFEEDHVPKEVYVHQIHLRDKIIDDMLAGKKFKYAIDLGSGTGFHLDTLRKYSDVLIATDFSTGALKESKKTHDCQFIVCDINRLPFKPGTIDLIWIAGVLHHIPNDLDAAISNNIAVILKKDGRILIDEPNKFNIINHINMKISKADPTGDERPLSVYKIMNLFIKNKFIINKFGLYGLFGLIGALSHNKLLYKYTNAIDAVLSNTFLKIFLFRWFIYAQKKE